MLAGAVLLGLRPLSPKAREESGGDARPLRTIAGSRLFIVAVVGAAMGQGRHGLHDDSGALGHACR